MSKDTQNAVLVLLSIVVVLVTVIGGGYWCFTYGDGFFIEEAANKTIVPKRKTTVESGEYAIPLDDNTVMVLVEKIDNNRDKDIISDDIIYKLAYARHVVDKKSDIINIYEYYAYKEIVLDENGNQVGYKYYGDRDKTNVITEVVEDIDVFETNSDRVGIYKYGFKYDNRKGYVFENSEKVR